MRIRQWLKQAAAAVLIQILCGVPLALLAQSWTTPRTWVAGELVNESLLNTHIRDNELYLFNQLGGIVPSGAILFRDASTATGCWSGWTEKTAARGFAIVGLPNGGTTGGTVGTAFTNLQDKTHTHSVPGLSVPGLAYSGSTSAPQCCGAFSIYQSNDAFAGENHTHIFSGTTSGGTTGTGTSGTAATSGLMAYVQFLVCTKT